MINYVYATDGKLGLETDAGLGIESNDPMELANFMIEHDMPMSIPCSSSISFAAEFGFEDNDGAENLMYAAIARYELFTEGAV